MKNFFKNNALVLGIYLIIVSVAVYFLLQYGKVSVHIYMNQIVGNKFLDLFFYYITYLGDGIIMPFLLLAILFYNIRTGIYTTVSFFTATIITNILKHQFYDDVMRPWHVFQWTVKAPLNYVNTEDLHIHNSFPSGHATQAFAIFMCLVFATNNPLYKFLFFAIALLAAFSRVYLSQHWLVDITAGSLIGTICGMAYYYSFLGKNAFHKLDKSLLKFRQADQPKK